MREREQATEVLFLPVLFPFEALLEPVPLRLDNTKFDVSRVRVALLQSLLDARALARAAVHVGEHSFALAVVKFGQP